MRRLSGDGMSKAFHKDIWRSIKKGWKRFLSILIITALGVGMMTGLYAACLDMYYSADKFFDKQNLFDIRILSTLGLTQEDVDALRGVDEVEAVEGEYSETVHTYVNGMNKSADMTVLNGKGLNMPQLLAGAMPTKAGEMAVTQKYLDESGNSIGGSVTIEEDIEKSDKEDTKDTLNDRDTDANLNKEGDSNMDMNLDMELEEETEAPTFANTTYTITGLVLDPKDIQGSDGNGSIFRSTATADYRFFVTEADVNSDIFTAVYITLSGTKEMNTYSHEYENKVQSVISNIESSVKVQREQARYDAVLIEAKRKIADAESTMNEKFAEADKKFTDAWRDIAKARQELTDGEATLVNEQKDGEKKISKARLKLENAKGELAEAEVQLSEGEVQLKQGKAELIESEKKLADGEKELKENEKQLADGEKKLLEGEKKLAEGEKQLVQGEAQLKEKAEKIEEGKQQLEEERKSAEEQFTAAEEQLNNVQNQLDTARGQLEPGIVQLKNAFGDAWPANEWNSLVNATAALVAAGADDSAIAAGTITESTTLVNAIRQIKAQDAQLDVLPESAVIQLALGIGKVNGSQKALDAQKDIFAEQKAAALQKLAEGEAELAIGQTKLEEARKTIESKKAELEAGKAKLPKERAKLKAGKAELAKGWAEWKAGKAELAEGWAQWEDARLKLLEGRTQLKDGKVETADGEAKLKEEEADAKVKIADAWDHIAEGKQELADGEAELMEQEQEYAGKKEEVQQKLADGYAKLNDIDMTRWYIQDRTALDSYFSLNRDLSSIEGVGKLFPVIFLLVAVLMSLTTMTRMVEEERGLIGTYKALGFGNAEIYGKYLLFALIACVLGGILGDIFGFIFMPRFVSVILKELYSLPQFYLRFDILYGVGGVLLFIAAIVGATVLACRSELTQMPATLLRPKAPRSGTRVWLERIPIVWNRLKFLNKVTIRNLFRYKKRMFMTIGGIMGCTALIICGLAIKDSVMELAPSQYDYIYQYDLMAVFDEKENDNLVRQLAKDVSIDDYLNLRIESVKLLNKDGESSSVQLMVIPSGSVIEDYIRIEDLDGTTTHLDDEGIFITQNATRILGLKIGDTVSMQNMELEQHEAAVSGIVRNYLGNNVYMTQKLYESLFGMYVPNGMLAHLSAACSDQTAYAETLLDNDSVLSTVSIAALREDFGFDLINEVVLLLIVMAGGLAFVVLFTLSNTNISERVRELATIKVLGFYDNEIYQYVNKETLILTGVGILIGLPVGRVISGLLTTVLNMPSIHFAVHIEPVSYLFSAAITFLFAIIVNWITNRTLNRINMVEALKSVE